MWKNGDNFSCGFSSNNEFEKKLLNGYFYTLDDVGNTVCVSEKLQLKFYEDHYTVKASSGGNVHDKDGHLIKSKWIQIGFRHGNNLALAYITDSNSPTGTGVYYLMARGNEYAGYWLGLDFPLGHKFQCPYILTPSEKPEDQTCEDRWPEVFTGEPCTILKKR